MIANVVKNVKSLGFPWETANPFLFCVHHLDFYPKGDEYMQPKASLEGRNPGNDFMIKDGWRMYHGKKIPGFPVHPHRGFETVTVVLKGFVDHSDSLGAAGRYGNGDVQWMTAGKGLQHCEMFPMIEKDRGNTLELFQIWLNLPASRKFVEPHFSMLWKESIPVYSEQDENGNKTEVIVVAGHIGNVKAPSPAPDSWAADPENEVIIWRIKMQPGAKWNIPPSDGFTNRSIFFFQGNSVSLNGQKYHDHSAFELNCGVNLTIENGSEDSYFLLLQGKPIDEPVVQYGPFVMNTQAEIRQAMIDFQRTQFGGWPWDRPDHVHDRNKGRFAKYADGKEEVP